MKSIGSYFLELFEDPNRLNLLRVVISEINAFPQVGEIMYRNTVERVSNEVAKQLAVYAEAHVIAEVDFKLAARSFLGMLYSFVLSDQILARLQSSLIKNRLQISLWDYLKKG